METQTTLPPFAAALAAQIRADDSYNSRQRFSDELLLKPYLISPEQRKGLQIIADMDAQLQARIRIFYQTAGIVFERQTGLMVNVLYEMTHESFGRLLLFAGHLVLYTKTLRDANRFGFASIEKLEEEGQKIVSQALRILEKYPEPARD